MMWRQPQRALLRVDVLLSLLLIQTMTMMMMSPMMMRRKMMLWIMVMMMTWLFHFRDLLNDFDLKHQQQTVWNLREWLAIAIAFVGLW